MISYHAGDTITSLSKATLVYGGRSIIVYTTLMGAMGVFVPFATREEVEFFQMLEAHIRNEIPYTLVGRDHTSYRSYYAPVKVGHGCPPHDMTFNRYWIRIRWMGRWWSSFTPCLLRRRKPLRPSWTERRKKSTKRSKISVQVLAFRRTTVFVPCPFVKMNKTNTDAFSRSCSLHCRLLKNGMSWCPLHACTVRSRRRWWLHAHVMVIQAQPVQEFVEGNLWNLAKVIPIFVFVLNVTERRCILLRHG